MQDGSRNEGKEEQSLTYDVSVDTTMPTPLLQAIEWSASLSIITV